MERRPRDLIQALCSLAWNYLSTLPLRESTRRKIYSAFKAWTREIAYGEGNLGFLQQLLQNPEAVKNVIDSMIVRRNLMKYRTLSRKQYHVTVYYLK